MVGGTLGMRGPLNIIKTPYTASNNNNGCLLGISLKFHSSPLTNDEIGRRSFSFLLEPGKSSAAKCYTSKGVSLLLTSVDSLENSFQSHELRIKKNEVNLSYHERNLRVGCVFNATNLKNSPIQTSPWKFYPRCRVNDLVPLDAAKKITRPHGRLVRKGPISWDDQ